MAPSRFAIPAALVAIATALIVLLALVMLRSLPAHVRRASPRQLRSGLALEMVGAALLLLGAPAAALQFAHGAGPAAATSRLTPIEPSLWPVVAAPVAVASIALGLASLRGRVPRAHAPLTIGSALVAGAILLLLSLAGRMIVADALLIGLMIPAWAWLMGEIGPRASDVPEAGGADSGPDRGLNPGPPAFVLCLGIASILGALALRPEWSPAVQGLTLSALGALLIPLALVSTQAGIDQERAVHAGAPVFLIATIPPLGALGIATLARIWLVVDGAGDEARSSGTRWFVGAAEALVANPYLAGMTRLTSPALLAMALPLVFVAMEGVSPGVRRLAGLGILVAGVGLGVRVLAGAT